MNKSSLSHRWAQLSVALACIGLCTLLARADTAYVTTYTGSSVTLCPTYCANPLALAGVSISASGSTAISSPPGVPSRTRCTFGFAGAVNWSIQPTLGSPGGVYTIETAHTSVSSCTSNSVFTLYSPDGTVSASCTNTPVMQKAYGSNGWAFIGYITNNPGVTQPNIIFYYVSGQIDNSGNPGNRVYIDAFRFVQADPCYGVAGDAGVSGPLAAGQTFVNVTGVTAGATNVTVYADGVEIAHTNYSPGFAAGSLAVPTSPLTQNTQITAGQTKNGCSSSVPTSGPFVGGGPNPAVKVVLSCWKNPTNAGPIGANSSAPPSGNPYFLAANGFVVSPGFGTAPKPGRELLADQCWQLVTFQNVVDPAIDSNTGSAVNNTDPFCSLEGLVFSIDSQDTGPYDIYVDQIKNGNTVVEDFESYADATTNTFVAPSTAGNPAASLAYLSGSPNSSLTSANYSFDGTRSCRIRWQFSDTNIIRWAHVQASAGTGKHYPQLDTSKPITARILVLPVGTTLAHAFNGTVSSVTNSGPNYTGGTNTLGVTVTGSGSYTYQWTLNGNSLPNTSTDRSYTIGDPFGVNISDNGIYRVDVNDGLCTESRTYAFTNADPVATITNQPVAKTIAHVGDNVTLTVGGDGHVPAGYPLTYQWKFNGTDITDGTDATFTTNNVQLANVGSYTVGVSNSYGGALSSAAVLDVVQPGVIIGTGAGLRGNYYTSRAATNTSIYAFSGTPTLSRIDPTVDFNFGSGSPDPSISSDFFTVRWSGQVQALDSDTYTFYTRTDDGARLWVNNQLLVNSWILQAPTEHSGTIALSANQQYPIVMEYYENAVGAVAQLSWSTAGGGVAKEIIPASQLYPASVGAPSQTLGSRISNGADLVLNFGPGSYTLQAAGVVTGPYTNVAFGVISPFTVTNAIGSGSQLFYRLLVQ